MSNIGPHRNKSRPSSPIKPFLLGLLLGIILVAGLATAIPEKTSPTEFVQAGWEQLFPPPGNAEFLTDNAKQSGVVQTASGLQYQSDQTGRGAVAQRYRYGIGQI